MNKYMSMQEDEASDVEKFYVKLSKNKISESIPIGEFKPNKNKREVNIEVDEVNKENTEPLKHANIFAFAFSVVAVVIIALIACATMFGVGYYTTYFRMFGSNVVAVANAQPKIENNALTKDKKFSYKSMVVIEPKTKRVLLRFNEEEKLPMASTTKIMTALLVIENIGDLNSIVTVPNECVGIEGTSIYLRKGEEISRKDLLYGLILASGNDCATALAILTAGSEESFVKMMNKKAEELGLTSTNFTNPHGLHNENHYTTAKDLAVLTAYALENETFREIVSTKRHTIEKTNVTNEQRYLKNKQKLMFDEKLNNDNFKITGVKSGFTPEAGRCLVTSCETPNISAICVVLNCQPMFEESQALLEEATKEFAYKNIVEPYNYVGQAQIINGREDCVKLYTQNGFAYPISQSDVVNITPNYSSQLTAPINESQIVGDLVVTINGEEKFSDQILTLNEVRTTDFEKITENVIENFM